MANMVFILLLLGFVFGFAILGALIVIGIVIYRNRQKANGSPASPAQPLSEDQAAEVVSTWNLMNH